MDVQLDGSVSASWQQLLPDPNSAKRIIGRLKQTESEPQSQARGQLQMCFRSLVAVEGGTVVSRHDFDCYQHTAICNECGGNPLAHDHGTRCASYTVRVLPKQAEAFDPAGQPDGLYGFSIGKIPGVINLSQAVATLAA
jgi:hypothetical protein